MGEWKKKGESGRLFTANMIPCPELRFRVLLEPSTNEEIRAQPVSIRNPTSSIWCQTNSTHINQFPATLQLDNNGNGWAYLPRNQIWRQGGSVQDNICHGVCVVIAKPQLNGATLIGMSGGSRHCVDKYASGSVEKIVEANTSAIGRQAGLDPQKAACTQEKKQT